MSDSQTDFFSEKSKPQPQRNFLTITQITTRIKTLLEGEVGEVWVRGEISGFKPSASGHLYFSLKDNSAVLSCALFGARNRVKFPIKDGVEVIAHGKISVYAPRGNYQFIVDHIEPLGAGALQLAFEQLKAKLLAEGLFDPKRKKPLPEYPSKIAIITSPTGAALQDMLNVLGRRNSGISILVVPALVQGETAPPQLIRALETVNKFNLAELIVLARGGGSLEDLWAFNNEDLVRAVAASRIPVISAVGHEVDFTLCDFAADLRAPTPSAAAEILSKNKLELLEMLRLNERRLSLVLTNKVSRLKSALLQFENRLISPSEKVMRTRRLLDEAETRMIRQIEGTLPVFKQMLDETHNRMTVATEKKFTDRRHKLEKFIAELEALSPLKVLSRGYTIVKDATENRLLKSASDVALGQTIQLVFHDGKLKTKVLEKEK